MKDRYIVVAILLIQNLVGDLGVISFKNSP